MLKDIHHLAPAMTEVTQASRRVSAKQNTHTHTHTLADPHTTHVPNVTGGMWWKEIVSQCWNNTSKCVMVSWLCIWLQKAWITLHGKCVLRWIDDMKIGNWFDNKLWSFVTDCFELGFWDYIWPGRRHILSSDLYYNTWKFMLRCLHLSEWRGLSLAYPRLNYAVVWGSVLWGAFTDRYWRLKDCVGRPLACPARLDGVPGC